MCEKNAVEILTETWQKLYTINSERTGELYQWAKVGTGE